MLRAARSETKKYSFSFALNIPYLIFGPTKQQVWPYMVSGLSVAGTKYTLAEEGIFSAIFCLIASGHSFTFSFSAVYS